jgi:hypothetical protein
VLDVERSENIYVLSVKKLYSHPEICPFCHQKSSNFQTYKFCAENQILQRIII